MPIRNVDWCTCRGTSKDKMWPSFTHLMAASDLAPVVVYVCYKCWKPTQPVWRKHIKHCQNCGDLHDSPWESWCRSCTTAYGEEYLSWSEARVLERILRTKMGLYNKTLLLIETK